MINLERISYRMNVTQLEKNLLQGYRQIRSPMYNSPPKAFYSNNHQNIIKQGRSLMLWKWSKRIGLGIVGALGVLTISGLLYQSISTKLDENKYPPIGKMIDVGGYQLHINCSGNGGPTVVLDAGMGCNSLEWALVQPEIAKFAQVCSYDRAGYGWSDESPLPRTSQNSVHELHTLLHNAGIPGPYILVGHSLGGMNMRLFASLYPEKVAGIVLVDAAHEDQFEKMPLPEVNKNITMIYSYTGLIRLMTYTSPYKKAVEMYPENIQEMLLARGPRTNMCFRTIFSEMSNLKESSKQLINAGGSLGNKPLIVITAGKPMDSEGTGYTTEQIDEMNKAHKLFQEDLVKKSTKGKQIIAETSDHMINRCQPKIIVESVHEIVNVINAIKKDTECNNKQ